MMSMRLFVPLAAAVTIGTISLIASVTKDLLSATVVAFVFLVTVVTVFPMGLRQEDGRRLRRS